MYKHINIYNIFIWKHTYVYLCLHIYMYVYIFKYVLKCNCLYTDMCMFTYVYMYIRVYIYICVCIWIYISIVYMHVYWQIYLSIYGYIYIHMFMQTTARSQRLQSECNIMGLLAFPVITCINTHGHTNTLRLFHDQVRYSMLLCVPVRCRVLQGVAVCWVRTTNTPWLCHGAAQRLT